MNKCIHAGVLCACLAFAVVTARADVIDLADGSRLVGTIELIWEGKATIVTEFAGKLVIDAAKIKSVATDGKVKVNVVTGDIFVGPVTSTEGGGTVKSAVGAISFKIGELKGLWPENAKSPEQIAADKAIEAMKPKWTMTLQAGVISTEGNTDTLSANGAFDLRRTTTEDMLKFYASFNYAEQDDKRNRNEYIGGVYYENNISAKWYWYTRFELEHDEFEDLDLRATAAAGVGYYWLREDIREFKTRVGVGYRHESYDPGEDKDAAILDLGYDYRRRLAAWAEFTHSLTYSPDVEEFNDYRVVTDMNLTFPIATTELWKFRIGFKKEYNSDPAPGHDRLDSTVYSNILVEIK